jgi:hypothetical protein
MGREEHVSFLGGPAPQKLSHARSIPMRPDKMLIHFIV